MRPTTIFATYFAALTAAAPSAGMSRKAPTESISLTNIISIVNTTEKVERVSIPPQLDFSIPSHVPLTYNICMTVGQAARRLHSNGQGQ